MKDTQVIAYTEQRIKGHADFLDLVGQERSAYLAGASCALGTIMQYLRDSNIFKRTIIKDADGSKTTYYIAK